MFDASMILHRPASPAPDDSELFIPCERRHAQLAYAAGMGKDPRNRSSLG